MPAQTVLAVDDDPSIRWLLEEIFAISGIPHTVMGSGLESIEWARTGRPVLAIVDVRLNGVDGIGIARRIAEVSPETRILFLTGYADTVRANVSQAELPHMLLEKPFDINVLLDTVREACRVGSGAGE